MCAVSGERKAYLRTSFSFSRGSQTLQNGRVSEAFQRCVWYCEGIQRVCRGNGNVLCGNTEVVEETESEHKHLAKQCSSRIQKVCGGPQNFLYISLQTPVVLNAGGSHELLMLDLTILSLVSEYPSTFQSVFFTPVISSSPKSSSLYEVISDLAHALLRQYNQPIFIYPLRLRSSEARLQL